MKRILSVTLSLVFLTLVFTSVALARPAVLENTEMVQIAAPRPGSMQDVVNSNAREDTLFLFAASGDGSYGTPGTTERGWDFDWFNPGTQEVEGVAGGWYGLDNTAQPDFYWHVASTDICAGTDTDMSSVPTGDGTNSFAAWCGAEEVCGWENPVGYGNNWTQWVVVDLDGDTGLTVDFWYSQFMEGGAYDFFQVFVEIDDVMQQYYLDNTGGAVAAHNVVLGIDPALFDGTTPGDVIFLLTSDGAWSDEDNLFPTNVGAVWLDNIDITGGGDFFTDFETGVAPAAIEFTAPAGAGDYATLYENLRSEDPCTINTTFAWAFFDLLTLNPEYGNYPVIAYGPPYVDNSVVSPVLEVDQHGDPIEITGDTNILFDWWVYRDNPLDPLIFFSFDVAARNPGVPCFNAWANDNYVYYGDFKIWDNWVVDVTGYLADSAGGGEVDALQVRLSCVDMCGYWCDQNGSGNSHPPAPFFDNMMIYIVQGSAISWAYDEPDRFQDNFAETNGFVRMDHAGDFDWSDEDVPVSIVDSTVVTFNADLDGGVVMEVPPAGTTEERPKLYMWWRIVDGPNAGDTTGDSADPEIDNAIGGGATDGLCFSPWIGAFEITPGDGEFWNVAVADFAHYQGNSIPIENEYAFDLNDEFFLPGDELEIFFQGFSNNGNMSTIPTWAMSSDLDLRSYYTVRCLPTGPDMLFVEDDVSLFAYWRAAFRYNGYDEYDRYYTMATRSGQSNGLAGRAEVDDIAGYSVIVWDAGNIGSESICDEDDKTRDDLLLTDWISLATQPTYLWIMGDNVANDLDTGDPFLTGVLGASLVESATYYDDRTGIVVPMVYGTHPLLQYLGGDPYYWVFGGCPVTSDFALVAPTGSLTETLQEWEVDPGDNAKAGLLNNDHDGNGSNVKDQSQPTKAVFNPYSYYHVRDAGYGLDAGTAYHRLFVGQVLENIFSFSGGGVNDVPETPAYTRLDGNFPNPFNPKTTIRFALANEGDVNLSVYDITGRLVKTLVDGKMAAQQHEVVWDGTNNGGDRAASGVYFYKLVADGKVFTDKMVMLK